MAATTIDVYSAELTQVTPPAYAPLKPNQLQGRVRLARFSYATGAGLAQNKVIALCKLPKGARIVGWQVVFGAMGTSATLEIGLMDTAGSGYIDAAASVSDNVSLFATGINVASAGGSVAIGNTEALYYGYETEKECTVTAKSTGAAWAGSKNLIGHVMYVVD